MVKAVDIDGNRLVLTDIEIPSPGPSEIRIDIKATAVNRADLSQRGGNYAPPPGSSHIMGLECAGIVDSVGDNVSLVSPGDKVCALLPGGGYAESVIVPAGQVLPIPRGLSFVEAAAIPEVFATAYLNIFMEAAAQPGESVLLHAGASGVGTAAIQMCSAFGNTCYVTAGNEQKIERCRELGAAAGCNRHREDFVASVKDWTDGQGVDVILDPVGGSYLADNIQALTRDGRLVVIGLMGGATAEVSLGVMMMKRLRIIGSTLRARSIGAKTAVMGALLERVWPRIEAGKIRPIIETVFPLAEIEQAHTLLAGNETIGKVVVQVAE